jgi:hypothetical protein
VAVAILSLVAIRYADRLDRLREQTLSLQALADATAAARGGHAAVLYWIATRPIGPSGHGPTGQVLREDGRWYRLPDAPVVLSVQDQRGLLPVNSLTRPEMLALLAQFGVVAARADAMADILEDYLDTDDLKRLNGAERRDYAALGLPPPRDDWMLSVQEFTRMPLWRDEPKLLDGLRGVLNTRNLRDFNPLTAPRAVLRVKFPVAADEQMRRLLALRAEGQLLDANEAARLTGLPMNVDEFILAPSPSKRVQVWAPGLPRVHEYNVQFTPGGTLGPWLVSDFSAVARFATGHDPEPFRLPGFGVGQTRMGASREPAP